MFIHMPKPAFAFRSPPLATQRRGGWRGSLSLLKCRT